MKNIIFVVFLILVSIVYLNVDYVVAQDTTMPQPVMQSGDIIPTEIQKGNALQQNRNNSCSTGSCPQVQSGNNTSDIRPNNVPPNWAPQQKGPPNLPPGQQMPPPNMSEGPQNVLIILDASYSMEEKIGVERKIDIAKRVVYNTVKDIPPSTRVGLRVYGHKIGFMGIYPCRKTELLVPLQHNAASQIIASLNRIQPTGQTPITYSIQTAVQNDFNGLNGPKRIILVSDGMETCYGNPCNYAVEMVRRGIDLKVDVVGFALKDQAAINQLKCISLSTGGKFYTADTEAALANSLRNSFHARKEVQGKILFNK